MRKKTLVALLLVVCILVGSMSTVFAAQKVKATNGQKFVKTDYKCTCPFTVSVDGTDDCYIYVRYVGSPNSTRDPRERNNMSAMKATCVSDVAFYVKAGQTVETKLPVGVYEVFIACGKDFYGPTELFGADTRCYVESELLTFYTDNEYYRGRRLELYTSSYAGSSGLDGISRYEFPTP